MNINNVVNRRDADNRQPIVDPMCPHTSPLPLEIQCIIFQNAKVELPNLALVCKNWKAIVDDNRFRETIRPAKAFGSREWKEYIGVDAGEEPLYQDELTEIWKKETITLLLSPKNQANPIKCKGR